MDRAEIARRVERAEKLLQKGKTGEALDEYLQVLSDDPQNDNVRQMAADICLSLQRTAEAVKLLGELFERQIAAGENTRASLTYKKLARYTVPTSIQRVQFGQILETSNRKLALETYESALEDLTKNGRQQDCLIVLKRLVALEPAERNFLRLGELCSQTGDKANAAAAFLKLAEMTEASGANAAQWFERAYTEDSTDPRIALSYGKSLMAQGQVGAAIFVLEPLAKAKDAGVEMRETYVKALLSANRLTDAEPLVWDLFKANPSRQQDVADLIGLLVDAQQDAEAVALARKLEQFQHNKGDRRAFVALMQDVVAKHRGSPDLLEFMSELFNSSNREGDYCQTLLKLFDLHCGMGNYAKAAECLDRAADVDAYEPGHQKRLELLRGKIDESRYKVIASRFTSMAKTASEPAKTEGPTLGAAALQDLMLQAEILVQYGMRTKAIERLQRIQELFPREEERNQDLQQLYLAAGMTPHRGDSGPLPAAGAASSATKAPPAPARTSAPAESADVNSFTKVADITRKLYRQTNAETVMSTAVAEIGAQWKLSRCIVATRKPGMVPSAIKEYHGENVKDGEVKALSKLVTVVQDIAISNGTLTVTDAPAAPELEEIRPVLVELGITSLLALPLSDGQDQMGVLLLAQSTARGWHSADVVVLKTISEQIVIALTNAGLRRLVKSLSVTDEQSGLLKRASYIDLLMAETRRAVQQSTPVTVTLMQFGKSPAMLKEHGEKAVEAAMQQIGQLFAANIRQNDLAFRYEKTTIALVLGETGEKEAVMAVEKLRKLLGEVKLSDEILPFSAGLAEAVVRQQFDPVDIVTEVINRADKALETAVAQGMGRIVSLAPSAAAAAVA
ncbi:MAG: tetratricopeptide repeat protein [Acidobacteriia bacterium]|jgi:GGDEF domain-containing protein/tetratricopeptide (TPR) repeat protein|nr:tetratricopeptide repeat protein [Terriglobia bacterium]